ncbi:P-loop ATPase, Sll1717 family [Mesobacillus selenatarsenatis]|uniref:Uncharacterized protein n=1 Tax=Mesobacillus selenatarsenatis TaxID=388741 RepID=A0A846TD30_9BACI|nr:hypothetical protein [Mesobacillus selenatarsenatis]NKE04719.1 hypothetical protein [Mesobacillus selenatarsenatis]
MKINTRDLLFGADSAEDDENLEHYFIPTGMFRAVKNQEKLIIVGRKGSGKSAIFHSLFNDEGIFYIKIRPNKYSMDIFREFTNKYQSALVNGRLGFSSAWKYAILAETSRQLKNSLVKDKKNDTPIVQESVNVLETWVQNNINLSALENFISSPIQEMNSSHIPGLDKDIDVNFINKVLEKNKIHILIDDLDNVWESSTLCSNYIFGLISCARELIQQHNIYVTIFIREDIFSSIETNFHEIDNIRQLIEPITWNPKLLRHMLARRIQRYFDLDSSYPNDYWYYVFPEKVGIKDSYKYMVERTQLRPREMVQFCGKSWDISQNYKKQKVDQKDIIQAEDIYSEWKLKDLCSEFSTRYLHLEHLFNAFSGHETVISKEFVENIIKDILDEELISRTYPDDNKPITKMELINFLYESGFIRARIKEDDRWKFRAASSHPRLNLRLVERFDIHPAYRKALFG